MQPLLMKFRLALPEALCTIYSGFPPVFVPNPDGEFAFRVPCSTPVSGRWDSVPRSVVDNFGDIGVCWRLARQLAAEHGISVRLWVNDLHSAARLVPSLDTGRASQWDDGVELRRWDASFPAVEPGHVVLAAFACRLPEVFIEAMARHRQTGVDKSRIPPWRRSGFVTATRCLPHPRLPLVERASFSGLRVADGRRPARG